MNYFYLMRLEALSSIAEITPFYGTLDEVFILMNTLWKKTRKMWDSCKFQLQKNIQRKMIYWGIDGPTLKEIQIKNHFITMLFNDGRLEVSNEEEYKAFMNFIETVKEPKMISLIDLYLWSSQDFSMTLSTINICKKKWELNLLDNYNEAIKKMNEIGIDLTNVWSYVFVEELSNLYEWEFINTVLFYWTEFTKSTKLIDIWNRFIETNKWKVNEICLIWKGMSKSEFSKLINSIDSKSICIFSSYSINNNIISEIIDLNFPLDREFEVHIVPINWPFFYKYDSSRIIALKNRSVKQSNSKTCNYSILNDFKIIIRENQKEIYEEDITFYLDKYFEWTFKLTKTKNVNKIRNYETISFNEEKIIINKKQIKERLHTVLLTTNSEEENKNTKDIKDNKNNWVIHVKSKLLHQNILKIVINIDKIKDTEFNLLLKKLESIDSLVYLSISNIKIEMALNFLEEYAGFSHLKLLVLNLKNKFTLYDLVSFKEKKKEIEENETKIKWFYTKSKNSKVVL